MAVDNAFAPLQALSNGLTAAVELAARSVVSIHGRPRIPSSGVVWRDGLVVSAHHTVKRDEDLSVSLPGGERVGATLVGRDPSTDLVALRLDGGTTTTVASHAGEAPRVGQLVLAVGRPGAEGATTSLGIVSTVGPAWRTWAGGEIDRFVRLDLSIYDGFSGGPLVDATGRVLGINSSTLARGTAVTIPAATVERVLAQLLKSGRVERGYLGVAMQPVRLGASLAQRLQLATDTGLLVVQIQPDAPAERAGILVGDIVVAAAGKPVDDLDDLLALLGGDRIGSTATLRIVRGGSIVDVEVTIGARPRGDRR